MRLTLKLLSSALLAMLMSACSDSSDPVDPSAPTDADMAYLTINVSSGSIGGSRADGDEYTDKDGHKYSFLEGISPYEQMRTLRAIIVRPDGTIEHNELLHTAALGQGFNQYTYASLKVVAGEQKTVYLFANEDYTNIYNSAGTTSTLKAKLESESLKIGSRFPADEFNKMIISNGSASTAPLIDNSGESKSYLPMSEVFDINIEAVNNDGTNLYQSADLFITRAAVKFGFYIDGESTAQSNFKITDITVQSLADREYLLPNNTTYSPAKYDAAGKTSSADRITTAYRCPSNTETYNYTFTMPDNFGIVYDTDGKDIATKKYEPAIYFAESPVPDDSKYYITVKTSNDYFTKPISYGPIALDNLPNLPRNTFVKVILKLTDDELEVIVQPYTGVWLEPEFGIER